MTGLPNLNRPAFEAAAVRLWDAGDMPIIPHELAPERLDWESERAYWRRCLDKDLAYLPQCDAIFMLRGWEESAGAKREYARARELGLQVTYE
jgi:hypothetical protein